MDTSGEFNTLDTAADTAPRSTETFGSFVRSAPIRIYTLGRLEIVVDGEPLRFTRCAPRKPIELLKTLLALGGRGVSQNALCDSLWADSDGHDAYRALVTTVYRLRRLLRHKGAVTFSGSRLALDPRFCWVDAWEFERSVADLREAGRIEQALALYRGRFLNDDEHPHAFETRTRLQRKLVRAALALGIHYETAGQFDVAISVYERALETESVNEELHLRLINCLVRAGQASAVAVVYRRCRKILATRLGVAPSNAIERAFRAACAPGTVTVMPEVLAQGA
jgi:LuxR family transcriptional regulator, maltose regulon positive regulatory protein